jgi:hypothetical protein
MVRQLVGLFVDDEMLAVGILAAVAVIGLSAVLGALPAWLAGLLLTISLPAALAASVLRTVSRALRPDSDAEFETIRRQGRNGQRRDK